MPSLPKTDRAALVFIPCTEPGGEHLISPDGACTICRRQLFDVDAALDILKRLQSRPASRPDSPDYDPEWSEQ